MLCRLHSVLPMLALCCAHVVHAADPSETCFQQLEAHPQLQSVRPLIALSTTRDQTLDMITNTRVPAAAEKPAIKAWVEARDICFVSGMAWREQHMPSGMRQLIELFYAKSKLLAAELYSERITYAEFAARRAALSLELHTQLDDAWRESHSEHVADTTHSEGGKLIASGAAAMHAEAHRLLQGDAAQPAVPIANCDSQGGDDKSCPSRAHPLPASK